MATAADPQRLEQELVEDLTSVGDRFADADFSREMYRTLTNARLRKRGLDGHVSLSWRRVEDVVNGLRELHSREPMALAPSGDEGNACARAEQTLAQLGWTRRPLDTSEHDDAHVGSPADPPPADTGARRAPVDPASAGWEAQAHEDAERERLRRGVG